MFLSILITLCSHYTIWRNIGNKNIQLGILQFVKDHIFYATYCDQVKENKQGITSLIVEIT
jgi:hypothetical protein